jgi:hypothetical protein
MRLIPLVSLVFALAACATKPPVAEPPVGGASAPTPSSGITRGVLDIPEVFELPLPVEPRPLTIAMVGDLMLGTDYPEDRLPADDGLGQLTAARDLLRGADIAFGNVEGALADGLPPVKTCKDPAACYLFRSPTRMAATFADSGFDVMSLANNHARDFGEAGRDASMAALDAQGIRHSGREGDVASWIVENQRVALIAFAPNPGAHSLLDIPVAAAKVMELSLSHDLVLVSFHGGGEGADRMRVVEGMETYRGEARGDLRRFTRAVIDAGADLVIGHGPHVPRGLELYQGRLIIYSLGNFATYFGIGISGDTGVAPLVEATLAPDGAFVEGRIHSFRQVRPDGVRLDKTKRALRLMRELTAVDFSGGRLAFDDEGGLSALPSP